MSDTTHISETVSAGQLRAFIERIERLEEEKKTIADDIKEVKAEAKGCGFSVAILNEILKLRKKDPNERAEQEALLDIYKAALGMLPLEEYADRDAASQSYAEAKGVERSELKDTVSALREVSRQNGTNFDGYDAETRTFPAEREITDTQEQPGEPARNEPEAAAEVAGDYLREPVAAEQGQIIREGDAPRETDRPSGDASCPDTDFTNPPARASQALADSPASISSPEQGTPFDNPRCLNGCHFAHSQDACHDCLIAWASRPKDEQVRLWAEANAARAA